MQRFLALALLTTSLSISGAGYSMDEEKPICDFPPLRHGLKAVFGDNGNDHGGDFETRIPRMMELFKELDVHLTRIELRWVVVESERGVYDWSEYDKLIGTLHENGVEPMLMFYAPPPWSMVGPPEDEDLFIRLGMENLYTVVWPEDQYKDDLRRFAKTAAERYRGKARLFEFWNEPDGMGAPIVQRGKDGKAYNIRFGGDPVRYTEWLKVFYEGVKEGNPDAIVGAGSLCEPFIYSLEAMYGSGGSEYFDAVTCHPYGEKINTDFIKSLREVMVRYGDWRKPIWITEFGWTTGGDSVDPIHPKPTTSMMKQAESIPPMFETIQKLPYVTQFYYFTLNNWDAHNGFGLVDYKLNKKPSFAVYKKVVAESPDKPRSVEAPDVIARAPFKPAISPQVKVNLVNEGAPMEVTMDVKAKPLFPANSPAGKDSDLKSGAMPHNKRFAAGKGMTPVQVSGGSPWPGVCALELFVNGNKSDEVVKDSPMYARVMKKGNMPAGSSSGVAPKAPGANLDTGMVFIEKETPEFYADREFLFIQCYWNTSSFYINVGALSGEHAAGEATEDGHNERLWETDCLQVAIDPLRDAIKGSYHRPDDSEFIFALSRNMGAVARRTKAMDGRYVGPFDDGDLKITHSEGRTDYWVELPWSEIHPGTPKVGDVIGVSVLVNNIENGERKVYEWGGGIAHKKLPALYGAVILGDRPAQ